MGREAQCEASFDGRRGRGMARLEEKDLDFRGDFRLKIPFRDVRSVEAKGGRLRVEISEGVATFDLGREAEAWALRIRYPRGLLDKLGVKPASRVSVLGIEDPTFRAQLKQRASDMTEGRPRRGSDLVFVGMDKAADLGRLRALRSSIKPDGAIWVVWPKGKRSLREDDVRAMGSRVGLVDVKVVSFSETLSALKMMIPVRLREVERPTPRS